MKKRFFPFAFVLFCLLALCAHAASIRFEGEEEANLGGHLIVPTHMSGDSANRSSSLGGSSHFTVSAAVHEHTESDDWTAAGDYHYHACTAEYCQIAGINEMPDCAAHAYENDICTVCGAKKTVQDIDGDGIYDIDTAMDLLSFAEKVNAGETAACANLKNDIDLSGFTLIPIGTAEHPYAGTFDGKGYTVRGIDGEAASDSFGLFGVLYGTVCNIKVEGEIRVTGEVSYIGGVVGRAKSNLTEDGAILRNIVSNVNITGNGVSRHIGGVLGSSEGLEGAVLVEKCLYGGKIKLPNSCDSIGGVMGYANDGVFIYCCGFTGSVSSKETGYPGGILGYVNNAGFSGLAYSFSAGISTGGAIIGDLKMVGGMGVFGNTYSAGQALFGRVSEEMNLFDAYNAAISDWTTGEAAFLMNGGVTSGDIHWRQTLGADPYPDFDGEIVYRTSPNSSSNTRPVAFVLIEPDYGRGNPMANVQYTKTGYTLAIASYKDGRLQEVKLEKQQPPLEGVTIGTRLDYGDADEIRVMIFDYNLYSLKPLCISDVYRPEQK